MRLMHAVAARLRLQRPKSLEERNILLLRLDTAIMGIPNAGIQTFLPVFLARLGASSLQISGLTTLPALVSVLVALPASAWVERQHNHARVTAVGRALMFMTFGLAALAPSLVPGAVLPGLLVALWAVQAIPLAAATASFTSVVGDVVPPRRRPTVNGSRWAMNSAVMALAVAGFGKLLDAGWLVFPRNYQLVFLVSTAVSILNVVLFGRIRMTRDYAGQPASRASFRQRIAQHLRPILATPPFLRFLAFAVVVQLGMMLPAALYSIFWVRYLAASDTIIGLRTTVSQIAVIAGCLGCGRYVARRGYGRVLLISAAGMGLYPLVTALSPNAWWLLPAAAVWGIASGALNVAFFEAIVVTAPPGKIPSFTAVYFVLTNVANVIGPLLGAVLAESLSIQVAFFIAAALPLGAIVLWQRLGGGAFIPG